MTKRRWTRGANGLWTTFDPVYLKTVGRARRDAIRGRLEALLKRDGWERHGNRWRKPVENT